MGTMNASTVRKDWAFMPRVSVSKDGLAMLVVTANGMTMMRVVLYQMPIKL